MGSESNAMGQAIASMNQYQQMGNTGAITILQVGKNFLTFLFLVA
ncbi:MAG TPA: hypothetical protein VE944_25055 [Nostoc sp.]|nr:hypothetical protein [Nostoc sp.]HYX17562.1 hypothetical protein [Nostoc sp.]